MGLERPSFSRQSVTKASDFCPSSSQDVKRVGMREMIIIMRVTVETECFLPEVHLFSASARKM